MTFKRYISKNLNEWKVRPHRKPLILRGARQVGKSTLVKEFAKTYQYSIILNLEKPADNRLFKELSDVNTIVETLFLSHNIPLNALNNTLLFIDEIQESPNAIQQLRYFYEEIPELHVITAGSLLEFSMQQVKSFPVGRVEYLYMHPLNFSEYLEAINHSAALEQLNVIPLPAYAHEVILKLFNRYVLIGGMPEVIQTYLQNKMITDLPRVYESIWGTYQNDVENYTRNETERKVIKHIMATAHLYIDQRIKFQNFGNSNYRSREVSEAMRNLNDASIIRLIYPTTNIAPPVKSDLKKSPKLQFLDTGIVNYTLNIQAQLLGLSDLNTAFKGAIVPHIIFQELMSLDTISKREINFWVREKKQSSAEVDLVLSYEAMIIPIEIKSGNAGALKSLHQCMDICEHPYAIRMYAGDFKIEKHTTPVGTPYFLMNLPYYLGTKIIDYMDYFVNSFR